MAQSTASGLLSAPVLCRQRPQCGKGLWQRAEIQLKEVVSCSGQIQDAVFARVCLELLKRGQVRPIDQDDGVSRGWAQEAKQRLEKRLRLILVIAQEPPDPLNKCFADTSPDLVRPRASTPTPCINRAAFTMAAGVLRAKDAPPRHWRRPMPKNCSGRKWLLPPGGAAFRQFGTILDGVGPCTPSVHQSKDKLGITLSIVRVVALECGHGRGTEIHGAAG